MKNETSNKYLNGNNTILRRYSPEMRFIITVIDYSPLKEKEKILAELAKDKFNWLVFLELAKKHHLTVLLAQKLSEYEFGFVPSVMQKALNAQILNNTERSEILAIELYDVLWYLREQNIDAIPFKGPTLARQLYDNEASRFSRDIDILIRKEDMSEALQILVDNGYVFEKEKQSGKKEQAYINYNGQYLMFSPNHSTAIEPHTMLGPSTLSLNIDYDALWQNTEYIEYFDMEISVFNIETLLLVLCIHGSKEKWRRLKWIIDIALLLEKNPDINWQNILSAAKKCGCTRMVYVALSLAHRTFNSPIPDYIMTKVDDEYFVSYLVEHVEKNIEDYTPDLSSIYNISLFIILIRENNIDKLKYLIRTIFTPRASHYELVDLPKFMFFCYPVVKVIHDYLLLPIWNACKFILKKCKL